MEKISNLIIVSALLGTSAIAMAVPGVNSLDGGFILPESQPLKKERVVFRLGYLS